MIAGLEEEGGFKRKDGVGPCKGFSKQKRYGSDNLVLLKVIFIFGLS